MKRPSAVRKWPTIGFTGMNGGAVIDGGGGAWSVSIAVPSQSAIAHAPTLISDTSTTDGSPERSRANSAAATPPAMIAPPIRRIAGILEGEPIAVQRRKLRARVARDLGESQAARVAEFLGEP